MDKTVAVIGLGYVALPLAIAFGRKLKTVGFDLSQAKVKAYQEGYDRHRRSAQRAFPRSQ